MGNVPQVSCGGDGHWTLALEVLSLAAWTEKPTRKIVTYKFLVLKVCTWQVGVIWPKYGICVKLWAKTITGMYFQQEAENKLLLNTIFSLLHDLFSAPS